MRGYLSHCCLCLYIKKVIFQCYRKAKTSPRLKGVKEQKENNILSYIACSFLLFCLKRWIPGLPEQPKQHNVFVYASWTWINTGMGLSPGCNSSHLAMILQTGYSREVLWCRNLTGGLETSMIYQRKPSLSPGLQGCQEVPVSRTWENTTFVGQNMKGEILSCIRKCV